MENHQFIEDLILVRPDFGFYSKKLLVCTVWCFTRGKIYKSKTAIDYWD